MSLRFLRFNHPMVQDRATVPPLAYISGSPMNILILTHIFNLSPEPQILGGYSSIYSWHISVPFFSWYYQWRAAAVIWRKVTLRWVIDDVGQVIDLLIRTVVSSWRLCWKLTHDYRDYLYRFCNWPRTSMPWEPMLVIVKKSKRMQSK